MTSVAAADDRLELLRSVTNVDRPTAERLLQRAKGDVAAAANLFFESGAILEPPPPPPAAAPPVAAASSDEAWPRLLGDLVVRAYTTVKLAAAEPLLEGDAVELDASASGAARKPAAGSKRKAADEPPPLRFRRPGGAELAGCRATPRATCARCSATARSRSPRRSRARSPASI